MLLDNETKERSAGQWLAEWTKNGKLDIVTGYFSVGGLSFLSDKVNDRVKLYRFILGDMVQHEGERDRALDLLNDNITLEAAFKLSADARRASTFLEQVKVDIKPSNQISAMPRHISLNVKQVDSLNTTTSPEVQTLPRPGLA